MKKVFIVRKTDLKVQQETFRNKILKLFSKEKFRKNYQKISVMVNFNKKNEGNNHLISLNLDHD
jgi:hypothetical protein